MIRYSSGRMRLCLTLLCLNIVFIWGNSLLPGSVSAAFSRWVKDLLLSILNIQEAAGEEGHGLLRKIAHFTEFCCLGMCLSWLARMLRTKTAEHLVLPLAGGFSVACMDETIQCFVPNRGPGILDVGIDTLGVILGVTILYLIVAVKKRKSLNKECLNETKSSIAAGTCDARHHSDRLQK